MRPIDADALAEKLNELNTQLQKRAENEDKGFLAVQAGVTLSEGELDAAPTLDAALIVHAQWILCPEIPFGEPDKECSQCHAMSPIWSHYCYNCGAKMDARKEVPSCHT